MTLPVWTPAPERVQQSTMTRFIAFVNRKHGTAFTEYNGLYRWSVTDFPAFWGAMWEFGEVIASRPYDRVVDDPTRMPGARWFEGARLNFAQNLLRFRDERARHADVPPFKILGTETLRELAEKRPVRLDDLAGIPGEVRKIGLVRPGSCLSQGSGGRAWARHAKFGHPGGGADRRHPSFPAAGAPAKPRAPGPGRLWR